MSDKSCVRCGAPVGGNATLYGLCRACRWRTPALRVARARIRATEKRKAVRRAKGGAA